MAHQEDHSAGVDNEAGGNSLSHRDSKGKHTAFQHCFVAVTLFSKVLACFLNCLYKGPQIYFYRTLKYTTKGIA